MPQGGFRSCSVLARLRGSSERAGEADGLPSPADSARRTTSAGTLVPRPDAPTPPPLDARATTQALGQEQALFDRNMEKDRALFRLQMAMGWTTFLLALASVTALLVYPPAAVALFPLSGVAAWNWRRTLRREQALEVVTKRSAEDAE